VSMHLFASKINAFILLLMFSPCQRLGNYIAPIAIVRKGDPLKEQGHHRLMTCFMK